MKMNDGKKTLSIMAFIIMLLGPVKGIVEIFKRATLLTITEIEHRVIILAKIWATLSVASSD